MNSKNMEYLDSKDIEKFESLKKVNQKDIDNWVNVSLTHTSTSIEGNTLTFMQTALVLKDNIVVPDKKFSEHLEVLDHSNAWNMACKHIDQGGDITPEFIKVIQGGVLKNSAKDSEFLGVWASHSRMITGSRIELTEVKNIPEEMKYLSEEMNNEKSATNIFLQHAEFEKIHPFQDGNGRTGRILMNCQLRKNAAPPIIIKDRLKYCETLERLQVYNDEKPYLDFMKETHKASLKEISFFLDKKRELASQGNKVRTKQKQEQKGYSL